MLKAGCAALSRPTGYELRAFIYKLYKYMRESKMGNTDDIRMEVWGKSAQEIINYMSKFDAGTWTFELCTHVLQYKYLEKTEKSTQNLVYATWALCGVTLLLVIVTMLLPYLKN